MTSAPTPGAAPLRTERLQRLALAEGPSGSSPEGARGRSRRVDALHYPPHGVARYVDPLSPADIADGIEDVLRNSAGLVEAGRRRAAQLTLEACVRVHDAVYGELAA